jgi:hypothetical protein
MQRTAGRRTVLGVAGNRRKILSVELEIHRHFHRSSPLIRILSQINPVHISFRFTVLFITTHTKCNKRAVK